MTPHNNISPTVAVTPLDALMAHFNASSKSVKRAFVNIILESRAKELEEARQKAMLRQSLTQAFTELKAGEARPIENLFDEL